MDAHGNGNFPAAGQARNAGGHPPRQRIPSGTSKACRVRYPNPAGRSTHARTIMNMNNTASVASAIFRLYSGPGQGQMELCACPALGAGTTAAFHRPGHRRRRRATGRPPRVRAGAIHSLCRRILPSHGRCRCPRPECLSERDGTGASRVLPLANPAQGGEPQHAP